MGRVGVTDLEQLSSLRASESAQQELIRAQTEATVTFTAATGWSTGVVMSYLPHGGSFWLTVVDDRAHARAMRRDPRVSLVISNAGTELPGRRMVSLRCLAHVHTDEATKQWFYPAFAEYLRVANPEGFVGLLDSGNRLVLELRPVRTSVSHDSRNLPGDGRGGPAPESDGEWSRATSRPAVPDVARTSKDSEGEPAMTATEPVHQDRNSDINDIIKATHRYARGLDASRPEEAIAAFTDDAYWDATPVGMERFEGREQILDFFRRDASATTEQYHVITNHLIEFDGPDAAHGSNYVSAESRTTSGGYIKAVAVNDDLYRRTSEGWKISGRTITPLTTPQMDSFDV